ncbi:ribonuclease HI family protein [Pseudoduganella sp. GCM10020061]|uniref:ribonuclease HI family protein n=1 Tax=Pseudoduganella sp. GCM10020061 TaxID=3317345 RepID=UPI00362E7346
MNDIELLAYKSERAASRKLAQRLGISQHDALLQTLTLSAGTGGLEALLDQRRALRDADAARAQARRERSAGIMARRALRDAAATPWRAWFDGSARPNPGRCTIGGVVAGPHGERAEIARNAGEGDSSDAEYQALIAVLEHAIGMGAGALTVYGDSKVVIDDATGVAHDAAPALAGYRSRVHELMARLPDVRLRWVPRHRNADADALSQGAELQA